MVKELVVVVVIGLLRLLMVIGMLVDPETAIVLMLTMMEEVLKIVQVELMEQVHELEPENEISDGRVTIILEPEIKELIEVKVTVMLDSTPIESLDMLAEAVVIIEVIELREIVFESIE